MSFGVSMKIYIIGMPFSGKTTTAKHLSERLNFSFIDLDQYIEDKYKVNINDLFNSNQDFKFRELETKSLKELTKVKNVVISTGGGIVLNKSNKMYMQGPVVLLDPKIEILKKRKLKSYARPLLAKTTIESLYKERKNKYYEFADKVTYSDDLEEIIDEIINYLNKKELI